MQRRRLCDPQQHIEAFVDGLLREARLPHELRSEARADFVEHLRTETEAQMRRGRSSAEAVEAAVERFGAAAEIRRQLERLAVRRRVRLRWPPAASRRGDPFMYTFSKDLQHALRLFVKTPGFTLVALLAIALGVGANTTIFTVVNGVLLTPMPYAEPDRLVRVWPEKVFNEQMLADVVEQTESFSGLTGYLGFSFTVTAGGEARAFEGVAVPREHFSVLGVAPSLGRGFADDDGEDVAILSYGLWQRSFGGERGILGRRIDLGGAGYSSRLVVGVMAPDYRPLLSGTEVWVPLVSDPESPGFRGSYGWRVVARLKPGRQVEEASAEMRKLVPAFTDMHPTQFRDIRFSPVDVVPLRDAVVRGIRPTLFLLLGAVGLVLLMACSNVANLLLARGTARQREIALRMALGASRARILRQLLVESVLLGVVGGLLGLGAAYLSLWRLKEALTLHLPRTVEVQLDLRILAFTLGVSLLAGMIFGTLPAWRAARSAPRVSLTDGRGGTAGRGQLTIKNALVTLEVALALVLVVGASLLAKSIWRLHQVDAGFEPDRILALRLELPQGRYNEAEPRAAFFRSVFERLGALPGVEATGAINLIPMGGGNTGMPYQVEGQPLPPGSPTVVSNFRIVTPDYFRAFGIRLLSGRMFDGTDHEEADMVGLINEAMARRHWPGEEPVGKRILTSDGEPFFTVVGVVSDIQQHGLAEAPSPELYFNADQAGWSVTNVMVRTNGDPAVLKTAVREVIRSIDGDVPIVRLQTMTEVVRDSLGDSRFLTGLFTAFAGLALALGMLGVYGVMSYAMSQRRREMGVRVALGATAGQVISFTLRQAMRPVALGVLLGVALALAVTRLLESLLFEVVPYDPVVLAGVSALLVVVGTAASFLPARRAATVDPMEVLRVE